jgi:hypothetical protein
LLAAHDQNVAAARGLDPGKFGSRESPLDALPTLADLHDQRPAWLEVTRRTQKDCPHQVEPVPAAARQRHPRLVPVFTGQSAHGRRRNVGRVAHNEAVTPAA